MPRPRLVIFARLPVPGRAKTRLIPALGPAGAARLQDAMTRRTLATARGVAAAADVEVWFAGGDAAAMAHRYGHWPAYVPQGDGDLGDRLARATAGGAAPGRHPGPVVVVGTDCPGLTTDLLRHALAALGRADVALGPAADGGYYLIGLRRPAPTLFAGVDWSTDRVLAQTRAAADRAGFAVALLPTLSDVDVPADLPACRELLADAAAPAPYAPDRVAVTGATGCLGRHFVAGLLAGHPGVRVAALVRGASPSTRSPAFRRLVDAAAGRLTLVDGDLLGGPLPAAGRRALAEADGGLWHFAASTNLRPATPDAEEHVTRVNAGGTAAVLAMLAASDRPGPLYHLSTAYVCGRRGPGGGVGNAIGGSGGAGDGRPVYEHELDATAAFRNAYERSKAQAEARVRDALRDGGLCGAIFRPSLVVADPDAAAGGNAGPGDVADLLAAAFGRAAGAGRPLRLRMPPGVGVNAVRIDWVTTALLALAPLAAGRRTYHLTAPADATVAAAAAAAGAAIGPVDVRFAAAAGEMSPADRLVDRLFRPYRPYFEDGPAFDRLNLGLDAPELAEAGGLDLPGTFDRRAAARAAS